MRDIKFRGKTIVNFSDGKNNVVILKGKWVHGGITYDENRVWIDMPYYGQIIVDKETVGQYTGLHDKNGKEIYEGDIVKAHYIKNGLAEIMAKVTYSEEYAQYVITNTKYATDDYEPLSDYEDLEVIGNVWDNPNLLEKQ